MNEQLNFEMIKLFNNDCFSDDFDPEGPFQTLADDVLERYDWTDIYSWFYCYLTQHCDTDVKVYNAINLFYGYWYLDKPINCPYELIGYIYYRIDIEKHWDEWGDFIDSFAIGILERCGKVNLMTDPYYRSWEDKNVVEAVKKWRERNES